MNGEKKVISEFKVVLDVKVYEDEIVDIRINGPLENKVLMYGIFERAKDLVRTFMPPASKIIQGSPSAIEFARKLKKS